ncbi:hypothetical protein E2C01_072593 [Portunus trituberculatus]|uniref:Uncharacterized protein n=1 Tax=Portunus trituberculatus TaxID=210409 RepID=A0A5B7I7L9_PORTR|nr:hypothetical protein [Portunus trituberculatus]
MDKGYSSSRGISGTSGDCSFLLLQYNRFIPANIQESRIIQPGQCGLVGSRAFFPATPAGKQKANRGAVKNITIKCERGRVYLPDSVVVNIEPETVIHGHPCGSHTSHRTPTVLLTLAAHVGITQQKILWHINPVPRLAAATGLLRPGIVAEEVMGRGHPEMRRVPRVHQLSGLRWVALARPLLRHHDHHVSKENLFPAGCEQ